MWAYVNGPESFQNLRIDTLTYSYFSMHKDFTMAIWFSWNKKKSPEIVSLRSDLFYSRVHE